MGKNKSRESKTVNLLRSKTALITIGILAIVIALVSVSLVVRRNNMQQASGQDKAPASQASQLSEPTVTATPTLSPTPTPKQSSYTAPKPTAKPCDEQAAAVAQATYNNESKINTSSTNDAIATYNDELRSGTLSQEDYQQAVQQVYFVQNKEDAYSRNRLKDALAAANCPITY